MNSSHVLENAGSVCCGHGWRVRPNGQDRRERIRAHVRFLSDDLLEGRAPGTRGDALAARYIAAQMAAAGLTGGAEDGSFFQQVPLMRVEALGSPSLTLEGSGGPVALEWLEEFAGHSQLQREAVNLEAELVFVGHGIRAPEYKWDDYAGVDVRGRWWFCSRTSRHRRTRSSDGDRH
ncbi:MAG: hypothetical protein HS123_04445 [Solibacteraceae bacterium]|nr:hypothetical protein [Solibacteraceae bacterium]